MSFSVDILPQVAEAISRLPHDEANAVGRRLAAMAEAAQEASRDPPVRPLWLELAGVAPGYHRMLVGVQWFLSAGRHSC